VVFRLFQQGVAVGGALFFLLTTQVSIAFSQNLPTSERMRTLSNERYWHLLMHYRKNLFGGYRSEADGLEFFLAPDGRTDPYSELVANVRAFLQPEPVKTIGPLKQHPSCAFPERHRYLKEQLGLATPVVKCPDFEAWRPRFSPSGATLVFASAYLNNPASMFGHTFLRIDSKPRIDHTKKNDLLDYGVNYSAKTGDDGGITFAVLGLIGGYPGFFSLLPYFEKVQEYSDVESRDLWEYPLHLEPEQIHRMIGHIWELGSTYFDYFFFDENCSYHLLSLLEVANPNWHLTDEFFYWVIPSDTVRVLAKVPGALGPPTFRPSLQRRLERQYEDLNPTELAQFEHARDTQFKLKGNESVAVLDVLIDQQKYDLMRNQRNETDLDKQLRRELLLARAKSLAVSDQKYSGRIDAWHSAAVSNRPDHGVHTAKLSVYGGSFRKTAYYGLQIRPVYHDLFDQDAGYLAFSELTIGRVNLRIYPSEKRVRLHSAHIAEVTSLAPSDALGSRLSWSASGGLVSPRDVACRNCNALAVEGGAGESFWLSPRQSGIFYGLLKITAQYSGWFDANIRFGPLVDTGALFSISDQLKTGLRARFTYFPTQKIRWSFEPTFTMGWLFANQMEFRFEQTWTATKEIHGFDMNGALAWYF